jgi:uncharacterized LabA/DUF88 family protein
MSKIAYIDAQNVHKAIEELWWILDWWLFYVYLQEKFQIDICKIFIGYVPKYESLYAYLYTLWYVLVFKKVSQKYDGTIKWNVDVDLTMHVMEDLLTGVLEKWYIISGDSDYNTLIERLRNEFKLGRLIVPNLDKTSSYLRHSAGNNIQSLQDLKHRIKKETP